VGCKASYIIEISIHRSGAFGRVKAPQNLIELSPDFIANLVLLFAMAEEVAIINHFVECRERQVLGTRCDWTRKRYCVRRCRSTHYAGFSRHTDR
jgi:hypothetical protein